MYSYISDHNGMVHAIKISGCPDGGKQISVGSFVKATKLDLCGDVYFDGTVNSGVCAILNKDGQITGFYAELRFSDHKGTRQMKVYKQFDDFFNSAFYRKYVGRVFENAIARAADETI